MSRCKDIDRLEEPFRSAIKWLIYMLDREGIPLMLFETWRSHETQEKYYARRVTRARAGDSPHNHGFAADFVLDKEKIDLPLKEWRGKMVPDAWDTTKKSSIETWGKYGELIEKLGLTWGGRWYFRDLPHAELTGWKKEMMATTKPSPDINE